MAGHSKWANIQHRKKAQDAKRGKLFTRLIREVTIAVKAGGPDPGGNPRLRLAWDKAMAGNVPKDTIERAVKRAAGDGDSSDIEEVRYEGYGPGGVAVLIEATTDNKNRTVGEIRHFFSKYGGNLGESGSVNWLFDKRGYLVVSREAIEEEELLEIVLDAGAEDVKDDGESWEIFTTPETFQTVREALAGRELAIDVEELAMVPQTSVKLEGKQAKQMLKLMESLEDHEDLTNVWANFDIEEKEIEAALS